MTGSGRARAAFFGLISSELEADCDKPYAVVLEKAWAHYEQNLLEHFPQIGGDEVGGTGNLTDANCFVAMGEVLKRYDTAERASSAKLRTTFQGCDAINLNF